MNGRGAHVGIRMCRIVVYRRSLVESGLHRRRGAALASANTCVLVFGEVVLSTAPGIHEHLFTDYIFPWVSI